MKLATAISKTDSRVTAVVTLSVSNLRRLLADVENRPDNRLKVSLFRDTEGGRLLVYVEDDIAHYADRPAEIARRLI